MSSQFAEAKSFEDVTTGRILSRTTILLGNILTFVPIFGTIGGVALALGALHLVHTIEVPFGEPRPLATNVAWPLAGLGGLVALSSMYVALRNQSWLANQYLRRVARNRITNRPDRIVDPDDPHAIFMEVVPRENWNGMMLETATDVGYLLVEERHREVLFEGDRERIRIPVSAIRHCVVESTVFGEGTIRYFFTIIVFESDKGFREWPVAFRGDCGTLGTATREVRSRALMDRILAMTD